MHLYRLPFRAEGDGAGGAPGEPKADPPKADDVAALKAQIASLVAADAKRLDAEKKAADADAKKRGEHEKLLAERETELATTRERLTAFEARETERVEKLTKANAARTKALPDAFRELVPAGLDADATAEFLDKVAKVAGTEDAVRGTRRGTTADEAIPAECQAQFDRYGAHLGGTVRDWYTNVWKPSHPTKNAASA